MLYCALPQIQETALLLAAQMVSQGFSMETFEVADEVGYTQCCADVHVCSVDWSQCVL